MPAPIPIPMKHRDAVTSPRRLILASGSATRRAMLTAAGVSFDVVPATIDEAEIMAAMTVESDNVEAADIAGELAVRKALAVAAHHPDAIVIGADQVLALGRRYFSKADTIDEARQTLVTLRGRTHELVSSVAVVENGGDVWQATDSAFLTMRGFSDAFLSDYLANAGDILTSSVGCYALEGVGVQLFERVEGDYFTVLGLPLLPLLARLRTLGYVAS